MIKDPLLITQDVDGADIWGPGPGQMIPIDPDLGETPILVPQPG
jgi:hypothetical protein